MESPPSPHALLPFAPGTSLCSKAAAPGHGAGEPRVSRLPTLPRALLLSQLFLAFNLTNFILGENQRENTQTLRKKNPTNKPLLRVLYRELLHGEKKTCQVTSLQMYLITSKFKKKKNLKKSIFFVKNISICSAHTDWFVIGG